jgi:Tfp pilus assembly protein PilZ
VKPVTTRAARYRVYLSVRYETAADFVREYAENLSRGGLFIRGARGLRRHGEMVVEVELPGFGAYQLRAEVVHVITEAMAAEHGRTAGAGLAIREAPEGFEEALAAYLVRLGRRADSQVLAADDRLARLLAAAGYRVSAAPPPAGLAAAIERRERPIVGVVVPQDRVVVYRHAAGRSADLVLAMDEPGQIDEVLVHLDRRL